jgi:uncharacterized protein (UPF0305 family)
MEDPEVYIFNSLKKNIIETSEELIDKRNYRTIFLEEFTKELIFNIKEIELKDLSKKSIENFDEISERIRKKILEQIENEYKYKEMRDEKIMGIPSPQPIIIKTKPLPALVPRMKKNIPISRANMPVPKIKSKEVQTEQIAMTPSIMKPRTKEVESPWPINKIPIPISIAIPQQPSIKFNSIEEIMNEIKRIFNDPRVILIECTGNDKFLLIRTGTRVMSSRIKLTEEEIKGVIHKFSRDTRIPLVNGLLNAVKDNLSISAIISETAGSKFLIKKFYLPV